MSNSKLYAALVECQFLHHYFLDEGELVYGSTLPADKASVNLKNYRLSNYMDIQPSVVCERSLRNQHMRFVQTEKGFKLMVEVLSSTQKTTPVPDLNAALYFDFIVKIKDQSFMNYTILDFDLNKTFFFSNLKPLDAAAENPVKYSLLYRSFTTFRNSPSVAIESDLSNDLTGAEIKQSFAILRIALTGDAGQASYLNAGKLKTPTPVIQLMFRNFKCYWKYLRSSDKTKVFETDTLKPFTKNGLVDIEFENKKYPNPSPAVIYKDKTNYKYYSDVFI